MLIAITSTGTSLDAKVDVRFGRAKFIILYNSDHSLFSVHDNNLNLNAPQGAGIQTAQNILNLEATVLITGNCGPKAFKVLTAGDIKIFSSPSTDVSQAISAYQNNQLNELTDSNVEGHWT